MDDEDYRVYSTSIIRVDNELFNDADNVVQPVISARRVKLKASVEDWEILLNGKISLKIKGIRFSKKEREFLRTVDGMKFLVAEFKTGHKSVVSLKKKMKKLIK